MTSSIQLIQLTQHQPLWVLETRRTAYVLTWTAQKRLENVYWGPILAYATDYTPWGTPPNFHGNNTYEEFPAWGDYKSNEPCLKVRFSDGVRACLLEYADATISGDTLTIHLQDPHYPLRVRLIYKVYADFDLIVRRAEVENTGDSPIDIEQILSAMWHLPRRDSYQLTTLNGKWGGEFQIQQVELPRGKQLVERRRGSSGFDSNPFFALSADGLTGENSGEVWFGALAFSGNYKLVVEFDALEHVYVTGGIHDFDFCWRLEAGETFVTPSFVAGYTGGGYGEASRLLHAYENAHVVPRANEVRPIVYNSWYVTEFDVSFENQEKAAELAAQMGVELFVMDDGWFGKRNNDRAGLGDWTVNREKFPNGLAPLINHVNELGMEFGIWVEPEMVNPDSDVYRAHLTGFITFRIAPSAPDATSMCSMSRARMCSSSSSTS